MQRCPIGRTGGCAADGVAGGWARHLLPVQPLQPTRTLCFGRGPHADAKELLLDEDYQHAVYRCPDWRWWVRHTVVHGTLGGGLQRCGCKDKSLFEKRDRTYQKAARLLNFLTVQSLWSDHPMPNTQSVLTDAFKLILVFYKCDIHNIFTLLFHVQKKICNCPAWILPFRYCQKI